MGETRPTWFPLGVADAPGRVGFVGTALGNIVAIDLRSGRMRWQTSAAQRPLIALPEWLVALESEARRVVVLDSASGGSLRITEQLPLPERSTQLDAHLDDERILMVRWQVREHYAGGAPPPAHVQAALERERSGVVRVDLTTGAIVSEEPGLPQAQASPPLEFEVHAGVQILRLRKRAGAVVELLRGTRLVTHATPDGEYVLVHQDQPEPTPWWIFSVETGERAAVVTHEPGARDACIIGERLYYLVERPMPAGVQPISLFARDLIANTLLWELSLPGRPVASAPPPRP